MGLDLATLLTCPACEGQLERAVYVTYVVHYRSSDCEAHGTALIAKIRKLLAEAFGRVRCTNPIVPPVND